MFDDAGLAKQMPAFFDIEQRPSIERCIELVLAVFTLYYIRAVDSWLGSRSLLLHRLMLLIVLLYLHFGVQGRLIVRRLLRFGQPLPDLLADQFHFCSE